MPMIGWIMSIPLCALLMLVPYFWATMTFSIYNGLFFKTANRNAKLIRAEWSRGKRILLLHFWDRRVCSRYRVWYIGYVLYVVHIVLTIGTVVVIHTPSLSSAIPSRLLAILEPLFLVQLAWFLGWFLGLLCLASSVSSIIPRHRSERRSKSASADARTSVGTVVIWVILIGWILLSCVWGIGEIVDILESL